MRSMRFFRHRRAIINRNIRALIITVGVICVDERRGPGRSGGLPRRIWLLHVCGTGC